jgi:hypothetical protein
MSRGAPAVNGPMRVLRGWLTDQCRPIEPLQCGCEERGRRVVLMFRKVGGCGSKIRQVLGFDATPTDAIGDFADWLGYRMVLRKMHAFAKLESRSCP